MWNVIVQNTVLSWKDLDFHPGSPQISGAEASVSCSVKWDGSNARLQATVGTRLSVLEPIGCAW